MPTKILSAAIIGIGAEIIDVEADAGGGDFGQISIVGLPDVSTAEAKERVRSALRNSPFEYPKRKITVNLAPASVRKHGPSYDLPIAVSILALKNKFHADLKNILIIGELSLNGDVRPVPGILAIANKAQQAGIKEIYIPQDNRLEAELLTNIDIYPVASLIQLIKHLKNTDKMSPLSGRAAKPAAHCGTEKYVDFRSIRGQEQAKRALEIAAAGGHSLIFTGPPGSGKTLLAQSLVGILPRLSLAEIIETTNIHSIAGKLPLPDGLITVAPFRAPHHGSSGASIIGGGPWPRPGEISLAHRGVLFLDEFPEFNRAVIESLRQPLEAKSITINRASGGLRFPSHFLLIAAMNPCPCGYYGDKRIACSCSETKRRNYRQKISGPLLDRIDIHLVVGRVDYHELSSDVPAEDSRTVRRRVAAAREKQKLRFRNYSSSLNTDLDHRGTNKFCRLNREGADLLIAACQRLNLSSRSYFRVLKIARTIADLAGEKNILPAHLAEAIQYRPKI